MEPGNNAGLTLNNQSLSLWIALPLSVESSVFEEWIMRRSRVMVEENIDSLALKIPRLWTRSNGAARAYSIPGPRLELVATLEASVSYGHCQISICLILYSHFKANLVQISSLNFRTLLQ